MAARPRTCVGQNLTAFHADPGATNCYSTGSMESQLGGAPVNSSYGVLPLHQGLKTRTPHTGERGLMKVR